MIGSKRDDGVIMRAIKLQNNNQHSQAARVFQDAGNQMRNPEEKAELWKAAERARRIAASD